MSTGALAEGWNGFSVLHTAASRVGGLDIGFVPGRGRYQRRCDGRKAGSMCCFCWAPTRSRSSPGAFVVYIGTHGDRGAHRADVILPGAAYTEKSGIYVNTEGRVQMAGRAAFPPGEAREDWAILRALSDVLGIRAALRLIAAQLRARAVLPGHIRMLAAIDTHHARQRRRPWRALGAPWAATVGQVAPFRLAESEDFYRHRSRSRGLPR